MHLPGLYTVRSLAKALEVPRTRQSGLTLLEVMIVVAIMGLVLAGALPAYEEALIRTKIADGLGLAAPYKDLVKQNAFAGRTLNGNIPALPSTSAVRSVVVADDGVITVSYKPEEFGSTRAARLGSDPTVKLVPTVNGAPLAKGLAPRGQGLQSLPQQAVIEWSCATESSALVSGPRGSLPSQLAPAECR